ncbi:MAG: hypothetical protein DBX56_08520 [Coriobacteriia bacterium]|nr:MAG: hypothetical protein DBX56_08520 [Coriobacteriia bacterium]
MQLDKPSQLFLDTIRATLFPAKGAVAVMAVLSAAISASYVLVFWADGQALSECLWTFLGFTALLFCLLSIAFTWISKHQVAIHTEGRMATKLWLACFAVLFISYAITLATTIPGTLSTDSHASISIIQGELPWSNAHPVFYTLLVGPFVLLGEATGHMGWGVGLFSLTQLTIMAAACAYACAWLRKLGMPLLVVFAALAFFTFNPVIARYATTMWKDIPFSITMLFIVLQLFEIALTRGKAIESPKACIKLALLTLLACLLRNNGIYAMAVTAIVLMLVWRRMWKWFAPTLVAVIVAYLISGPFYTALGIAPSPFRESVGIPIQQMSAVVAYGGDMTDEQLNTFSQMVDPEAVKEVYNPQSSNLVKYHESFSDEWLDAHKGDFLKLYLEVGAENPGVYLQAWVNATKGYWNMDTHSWVVSQAGSNLLYDATGLEIFGGNPDTNYGDMRKHSFVSPLFNMGFGAWLIITLCALRWIRRDRALITAYIPLIALWGTMLIAAPYFCEFRYLFPIHLLLPIIAASAFWKMPQKTE